MKKWWIVVWPDAPPSSREQVFDNKTEAQRMAKGNANAIVVSRPKNCKAGCREPRDCRGRCLPKGKG